MNSLVHYASDSEADSDSEQEPAAITASAPLASSPASQHQPQHDDDSNEARVKPERDVSHLQAAQDDGFITSALRDLQRFAALTGPAATDTSVVPNPNTLQTLEDVSTAPTIDDNSLESNTDSVVVEDGAIQPTVVEEEEEALSALQIHLTEEQRFVFDSFLKEIDAVPLTSKDQTTPPRSWLPTSSPTSITHGHLAETTNGAEPSWEQAQSPQSIYSRMYQLSLVSCPTIDYKEMESRLIEFAIRILDWEKGGMKPTYFMGEERVMYMAQRKAARTDQSSDMESEEGDNGDGHEIEHSTGSLPPYGGVVGEMLDYMHTVEHNAVPKGWKIVWNSKDYAYGYKHIAT
ncbi:hypothetical protein EDD11_005705 [Mortierella claussenii]|nr:hypothetical protein EDD11_005705 [Mortierella claussenii]